MSQSSQTPPTYDSSAPTEPSATRSPLSVLATIVGGLLIVVGVVALATGEFDVAGVWILAVGLAAIGVTGLVGSLTAAVASN